MNDVQELINKIGDVPFITDRKKEAEYIKKAHILVTHIINNKL